ncbi:MAG: hypothetical protein P4M14_01230 [Gammaproteobacteria bacterium]|nr:hypothetical protein [Gammaproteobacteria bacterium]
MNSLNDSPIKSIILNLVGQVIILLLAIVYLNFYYFERVLPNKRIAEDFHVATCVVTNKELVEKGGIIHRFRASFLLTYTANDQVYRSVASGNGMNHGLTTNKNGQQDILDQFNIGMTYPCWFNPENPRQIVLVQKHDWSSTLPLMIPSIIIIAMIYYIFSSIFTIIGTISSRKK